MSIFDDDIKKAKQKVKDWTLKDWSEYLNSVEDSTVVDVSYVGENIEIYSVNPLYEIIAEDVDESSYFQVKKKIKFLIKKLYPAEQEILKLIYWDEMSLAEVARFKNLNKSTVTRTHQRALRRLKEFFHKKIVTKASGQRHGNSMATK